MCVCVCVCVCVCCRNYTVGRTPKTSCICWGRQLGQDLGLPQATSVPWSSKWPRCSAVKVQTAAMAFGGSASDRDYQVLLWMCDISSPKVSHISGMGCAKCSCAGWGYAGQRTWMASSRSTSHPRPIYAERGNIEIGNELNYFKSPQGDNRSDNKSNQWLDLWCNF